MVQHIVLWVLKEDIDRDAAFNDIKQTFDAFKNEVPGLLHLNVYRSFAGYDVCLMSQHESREALNAYQQHPGHLAAKAVVAKYRTARAASDFEL